MADQDSQPDPFDSLLGLEDQYYTEGYKFGFEDGSRAGRIEGRVFGLENGFEKYAAMGALAGKAAVWKSRLGSPENSSNSTESGKDSRAGSSKVPPLGGSNRLARHIERLSALTEAETLLTENNEESVNDFDDRLSTAQAKATLVSKIVGEVSNAPSVSGNTTQQATEHAKPRPGTSRNTEMEDFSLPQAR